MALRLLRVLPLGCRLPSRLFQAKRTLAVFSQNRNPFVDHSANNYGVNTHLPRFSPIARTVKTGLSPDEVTQKVLEVCSGFEKMPVDKLNLDSHFMKDLGLDSLDHIEVIMEIENEFWLEIPDVEAEKLFTPRDIVNHVCTMMEKAAPIE